ncbi:MULTISPECIES: hypothetical protein [Pseudomonas syringae group genomosp. 2]|uniref:Uncharacterized protein n=3 Tax=Pseudomonas syringae group genomosp. 2 TaxID=251698 RepID=A0AAX1VTG6_PSEAJ|nr:MULTISPECIES: hypothetical protein [Pseudomonas syringae group genomosp. 2]KPX63117.1 Uncharacterized protein ALO35_03765 [Pseudomonas amygdali pv. lachrymans]KEZ27699.1 hypothetical protein A3SK_0108730 [Pseudomonas amygdali pv. tabaci str. 6605]KPY83088.1 Uncharacterized protein ALO60_02463 [Pseudomonas amygdali pv. tabaci]QOI04017.1 hypothetical protein D5S10_09085 [Pseudomonas savastanoi]RML80027.1 hypothetical protein ALQ89_00221 [Pseudomonas amygdali pv. tabaci]
MIQKNQASIPALLIQNVPRNLIMGVEDAVDVGALRAYLATKDMDEKHRKNALGQMRAFHMNESFEEALRAADAVHTPLRGNGVVVGQAGIFKFGRVNMSSTLWNNIRRGAIRRQLAEANLAMTQLIQPSLFAPEPINTGTFFFVACFSGSLTNQPEAPLEIHIAVPDAEMKGWLFREPVKKFLSRYYQAPQQVDLAVPKLKTGLLETDQTETGKDTE